MKLSHKGTLHPNEAAPKTHVTPVCYSKYVLCKIDRIGSLMICFCLFTVCKWVAIAGWNNGDNKEKSVFPAYFQSSESF